MEPSDLNTHLPPRKRLLAGFRTAAAASSDASEQSPPPPSPLILPDDLAARLRGMMGPPASTPPSPEEIIQAARHAASAAADAAAAARAVAADKAAVAAKARAAARAAMELLDSISIARSRNGIQLKAKSRKKHVQVKLLYRPPGDGWASEAGKETVGDDDDAPPRPRRRRESDEEVARKLHRVMNSSPRISFTGPKRPSGIDVGNDECHGEGGGDACNGSSMHTSPTEVGTLVNGCSAGKSGERTVHFTKIRAPDGDGEESSWNAAKSRHIADNGVGIGNSSAGRKVKIKRKQLFLNHHDSKEREERTEPAVESIVYDELKSNGTEKRSSFADSRAARGDDPVPMKISSVWKFKKFKPSSHCSSSDSKMLHNVCSSAEASASVKAD